MYWISLFFVELDDTMIVVAIQIVDSVIQNVVHVVLTIVPIQNVVSGPTIQCLSDLGSPNLASPSENMFLGVSFSLVFHVDCSISSRVWQNNAAKLEEGQTTTKGKRPKSPIPPLDMNLQSYKGHSKSKKS